MYIGTNDGVMMVTTVARRGEENSWRKKEIEELFGAPWEPIPGRGVREVKSRAHIEGIGTGDDVMKEPQIRTAMPQGRRLNIDDLEKCGYAIGCQGCKATHRGQGGVTIATIAG